MDKFEDLLRVAQQLLSTTEDEIGPNTRPLAAASLELLSKVTTESTDESQDLQANLLLGSKGVDLPQVTEILETLGGSELEEPQGIIVFAENADEVAFLTDTIISAIESKQNKSFERLHDRGNDEEVRQEWLTEKWKMMNCLEDATDPPQKKIKIFDATCKRDQEKEDLAYIQCLIEYNKAVIDGITVRPNLIESHTAVAKSFNDKEVCDMWNMVDTMTHLPPELKDNPPEARYSPKMVKVLIRQARSYLEDRFKQYMEGVVQGNLVADKRGGVQDMYSLVRAYVYVLVATGKMPPVLDSTQVKGLPFWPLIYYCLRGGSAKAALQFALKAGQDMEENLTELMYASDCRLSPVTESLVRNKFRREFQSVIDPYKRAVYCILGACDINESHNQVAKTSDDYLWIKLCQVRESTDSEDTLSYSALQSLVLKYSDTADRAPLIYFQLLFLTGQWEAAIEYLIVTERLQMQGVHLAIFLQQKRLLAMTERVSSELLVTDPEDAKPMQRMKMKNVIWSHILNFEFEDKRFLETLHYLYCLRSLQSPTGVNMFIECVKDYVMFTEEFKVILGSLSAKGHRLPGLIDKFSRRPQDSGVIPVIIERVAASFEEQGSRENAILLYELVGNPEKTFSLMSELLAQVVAIPNNEPGSSRKKLKEHGEIIIKRMGDLKCRSETAITLISLMVLLTFFDEFYDDLRVKALETLQKLKLIPMSINEVQERVSNFENLQEPLRRVIPDVLLTTMNILLALYRQLRFGPFLIRNEDEETKEQKLIDLRERATAINKFAATVPYWMPNDVFQKLNDMESIISD